MRFALQAAVLIALALSEGAGADVPVDLSGFRAEGGVEVRRLADAIEVAWPAGGGEVGRLVLELKPGAPLIRSLGLAKGANGPAVEPIRGADLATFITVGGRVGEPNRPPGMSPFNAFFDSPGKRPYTSHAAVLSLRAVKVSGKAGRASLTLGDLACGPFAGELVVTVHAGSRLVHVEAVVATAEPDRAFFYDAGIVATAPSWRSLAWVDDEGRAASEANPGAWYKQLRVRHRAIAVEGDGGSVAVMPPPHAFFFPRDYTENLATAWLGRGASPPGFGVRQSPVGGGNFSPWFNAPPGTRQRLGVFYALARGPAPGALAEALRYTRGDRFAEVPGFKTFTSHWHMAIAVAAMARGKAPGPTPDFVNMFKGMGVNIVHLAEFHGDGHPNDPGPVRLAELEAMFAECRGRSDASLLFLPGEEANVHLGPDDGRPAGHWLYLFPRPVRWTMRRAPGQPFREETPGGVVYHVGNRDEMARLIEVEHGLAWTAHARIKASTWAPDCYREMPFYRADSWLGAAWKAMPADLSSPRLGDRGLNLLDDMANWGGGKYLLGEVDVFKLHHTDELYGHMNVNYLQLDRVPAFGDDWTPLLDALRRGRFFVTTGEVLMPRFQVGGRSSGETLSLGAEAAPEVRVDLEWTFPLKFLEVVSGDGSKVFRTEVDLADSAPFGRRTVTLRPDLKGRRWVRVAAWDVAGNGAFSQPVWLGR